MGWLKYVPYVGKGLQWLEFFAEQSPYWPKRWPKPSTWVEHKVERALEYLARNEGRAFDVEAFGSYVGMSRKRYGFVTPDSVGRGKKTRFSDFGSTARNLDQEFRDAAGAEDTGDQIDNIGDVPMGDVVAGGGPSGQRRYVKRRTGRPKSARKLVANLARTGVQDVVVRYQNVQPYRGVGELMLQHTVSSRAAGSTVQCAYPVHLYDITSLPLYTTNGGQPIEDYRINPAWVLRSNDTGKFSWFQCGLKAQNQNGIETAENARWWIELAKSKSKDSASVATFNSDFSSLTFRDKMLLRWTDIRLQLFGPRYQNTKCDVFLVKFKQHQHDPYTNGFTYSRSDQTSFSDINTNTAAATGSVETEDQNEFDAYWRSTLKPRLFNPMDVVHSGVGDMFHILAHQRVHFKPDMSTNLDAEPACVDVRMYHKHDKIFNLNWDTMPNANAPKIDPNVNFDYGVETGTVNEMEAPTVQVHPGGSKRSHPYMHPSSRVFLLIIGDSWNSAVPQTPLFAQSGTVPTVVWPDPMNPQPWATTNGVSEGPTDDNIMKYNIILRNKWMMDRI